MTSTLSPAAREIQQSFHVSQRNPRLVHGLHLRYLLTDLIGRGGEWSPASLAAHLTDAGFDLGRQPAKTVGDALRWECGRGRVRRVGRARYVLGEIPDTTRRRLRRTARARRELASSTVPGVTPTITPELALVARKCWGTLEAFHGFIYFAAEATEEYAAIGLHGRSGYFASRSAAMGRVNAATVDATFYNFHPDLVAVAMADVPADLTAEAILDARLRAADRGLRARLDADAITSPAMVRAAELAVRAARRIGTAHAPASGRPLGLAHARLPEPDAAHLRLWWAITALREYRGDGHIAQLVDAELSGLDALILHGASGAVPSEILRSTRAWSEDEWNGAVAAMAETRGLVRADGTGTDAGLALRDRIDARTDELAAPAWAALTTAEATELRELVRPWSAAIQSRMFG